MTTRPTTSPPPPRSRKDPPASGATSRRPPGGITFNQFVITGDEPLLFHTGARQLFPAVTPPWPRSSTQRRSAGSDSGHALADPTSTARSTSGITRAPGGRDPRLHRLLSLCLSDIFDAPAPPLVDGEVIKWVDAIVLQLDRYTAYVPGPSEAGVLFDETTKTLFCGDLFARTGPAPAMTTEGITDAAIAHDQLMHGHAYTPTTGPTLRRLADLEPQRLALMHGPTFTGDMPPNSSPWRTTSTAAHRGVRVGSLSHAAIERGFRSRRVRWCDSRGSGLGRRCPRRVPRSRAAGCLAASIGRRLRG